MICHTPFRLYRENWNLLCRPKDIRGAGKENKWKVKQHVGKRSKIDNRGVDIWEHLRGERAAEGGRVGEK